MIPAASDWIAVPIEDRARLGSEGWAQHSEAKRPVRKRGRHTLHVVVIMWQVRPMPRGDAEIE